MTWKACVPGKAVLIGEYAVTDGLPAYSLAVDRFAEVQLEPCEPGECELVAPQVLTEPIGFSFDGGGTLSWNKSHPQWPKIEWTTSLIDRMIKRLRPAPLEPFRLIIDTSNLFLNDQGVQFKLGLGSSSAITIGIHQVLARHLGRRETCSPGELFSALLPSYREAQGGEGSGIDLATSIHGGLIRFMSGAEDAEIKGVEWPDGLLLRFAWTGQAASTPELLKQYRAWQSAQKGQALAWKEEARTILEQVDQALIDGSADALVGLIAEYGRGMSTIGRLIGVDLTPSVHRSIMREAKRLRLAAKPSGAGVGDLALIAGTCPDAMQQMGDWMRDQGIPRVEMEMTRNGAARTFHDN